MAESLQPAVDLTVREHAGGQVAVEGLRPSNRDGWGVGRGMGMGMGHGMAFHFRATCAAARTFQQSPCSAVSNRQLCQTMHTRLDKSEPHAAHSESAGSLTCILHSLGLHLWRCSSVWCVCVRVFVGVCATAGNTVVKLEPVV